MAPPRKRAALRLLEFVVTHSAPISALAYVLGLAGVLALPFLARNTYIDENAMLAGSAAPGFGYGHAADALAAMQAAVAAAAAAARAGGEPHTAVRAWLLDELRASGLRAEEHAFEVAPRRSGAVQRGGVAGVRRRGVSVVAVARAQRGDSKEALVLVTPLTANGTLGLGLGVALMAHLADVRWLSRDVLWLAADAGCAGGAHAAAEAWLADYHETYGAAWRGGVAPVPPASARFLRGGVLTAALVLDAPAADLDALQLRVQGTQGALPNLDIVGLLRALAGAPLMLHGGEWGAGEALHPRTWHDYQLAARAAARFMARQARGEPDGAHGAFLDAAVDAATVALVRSPHSRHALIRGEDAALRVGQLIEGCIRSLSNLLERLHHSSAFYIMLTPGRFVGAAVYMPPGGLLLGAALLLGAGGATRGAGEHWPEAPPARDWAHALAAAAGVYGACFAAGAALLHLVLPARDRAVVGLTANGLLACWGAVTTVAGAAGLHAPVLVVRGGRALRTGPWVPLKALMLAGTCLWLAQAVILNTGLALPCAALLMPACLAARPTPPGGARGVRGRCARAARWLLLAVASPPVVLVLAAQLLGGSPGSVLWRLAEHAAEWDTLSMQLAFGAYLPCFIVCAAILAA